MLPAYFSNMAPVFFRKSFHFLNFPLDFNKTFKNKPILGKNKTFRGLIFGIIFALLIGYLQFYLYQFEFFKNISFINYNLEWIDISFLLGFGALFGDAVKSFFKRQLTISPGDPFVPFDQIDYSIGALIFVSLVYIPDFWTWIAIIILGAILHIIINHLAFYL
jgi:CDP-2,3-bis-(O-geranylgeranyl)-sn-glycerol synthase